jgi:hypothetical protein
LAAQETEKPRTKAQPLIREGFFLAAVSATAYYIAFSFETGYADCFGYPHWAIDVSTLSVIIAWASIAGFLLLALTCYFMLGLFIPARGLRIVVFNRPMFFLIAVALSFYAGAMGAGETNSKAIFIAILILGSLFMLSTVDLWGKLYRATDKDRPRLDRIEAANVAFAENHNRGTRAWSPSTPTLSVRTLEHPGFGPLLGRGLVILLLVVFGGELARSYGEFQAGRTRTFLTSTDVPHLVALRRYGDNVLSTLASTSEKGHARSIIVVPWQAQVRTWVFRELRGNELASLACQGE